MYKSSIFSIGHGNKTIEQFLNELKAYQIEYVFDVRSKPFSRFNHFFNKSVLEAELVDHNITYVFVGEHLGGLPNDITCYVNGKVDYRKIKDKSFFKQGINLLLDANKEGLNIALMCSESKPEECHRSKLIGQELLGHGIMVNHIISSEETKDQIVVIDEIMKGKNINNLFGESLDFTSRKNY
jgi:uncharacterized protein (DUF488 family)